MRQLEVMYENLLDITSSRMLVEQDKVAQKFEGAVPTEFEVGSFVLVSYLVRPPSELHCRLGQSVRGSIPYHNNVIRLRVFLVATNVDYKAVTTFDLGEAEVGQIQTIGEAHRRRLR